MGIRWFLKNVCADVTLYIFYYFCIQEIHGLVRYFMGECNGWYNTVEVLYKGSERTFVSFPDERNVVDEPYPVNYVVGPFRSVYKFIFKPAHIYVRKIRCNPSAHCCTLNLDEIVVVKFEIVQFEDFFEEASKGFCGRLDLTSFCQFLLNYSKSIVCVYISV